MATSEDRYLGQPTSQEDSALDLRISLSGKGFFPTRKDHVLVVESAADADLAIEVLARRAEKNVPGRPDRFFISLLLKAGGRMHPDRFLSVSRDYRFVSHDSRFLDLDLRTTVSRSALAC